MITNASATHSHMDAYGNITSRTGTDDIIFQYNGKFGVITDSNGLCYMRARYYSPTMHRFINADIVPGTISNAVTLNRFAFANANPISKLDPLGLYADDKIWMTYEVAWGSGTRQEKVLPNTVRPVDHSKNRIYWAGSAYKHFEAVTNLIEGIVDFFDEDSHSFKWDFKDDIFFADLSASGGNNDFSISDGVHKEIAPDSNKEGFTGADFSLNAANIKGRIGATDGTISVSLNGNIDILAANLAAGLQHKDGLGTKAGAGASVASAEGFVAIEVYGFGVKMGVSGDFLSAKASLNSGVVKQNGKTKIEFKPNIGAGWWGYGWDIGLILPF